MILKNSIWSLFNRGINRRILRCLLFLAPICSTAIAQVPEIEREALIALYNATDGENWTNRTNWRNSIDSDFNPPGTECGWYGVSCFNYEPKHVRSINLARNNLSGSIPAELANLTELRFLNLSENTLAGAVFAHLGSVSSLTTLVLRDCGLTGGFPVELISLPILWSLDLSSNDFSGPLPVELSQMRKLAFLELGWNRFSGSIPLEIGDMDSLSSLDLRSNQMTGPIPWSIQYLSSLSQLLLSYNQFSGPIPPEIGTFSRLHTIVLDDNSFSGSIPPEIGNLTGLRKLSVRGNLFSGAIPIEITNTQLAAPGATGMILSWNALFVDDPAVQAFVDETHRPDYEFEGTQTVAPLNLVVDSVSDHTVWVSWDSIPYTEDEGGYTVFYSEIGMNDWIRAGFTSGKATLLFPVTGLDSGESFDLAVAAYTNPHEDNLNLVASNLSESVTAMTSDLGCAAPEIVVDPPFGRPYQLSVGGAYDSHTWSTGETTDTISVAPESATNYWVTVTSPGPCEETAVVLIDPTIIYGDGFESGDTSWWTPVGD